MFLNLQPTSNPTSKTGAGNFSFRVGPAGCLLGILIGLMARGKPLPAQIAERTKVAEGEYASYEHSNNGGTSRAHAIDFFVLFLLDGMNYSPGPLNSAASI
jgi:hypothetical protein